MTFKECEAKGYSVYHLGYSRVWEAIAPNHKNIYSGKSQRAAREACIAHAKQKEYDDRPNGLNPACMYLPHDGTMGGDFGGGP